MAGNVEEWTVGTRGSRKIQVKRGGEYMSTGPDNLRVTHRNEQAGPWGFMSLGFRSAKGGTP